MSRIVRAMPRGAAGTLFTLDRMRLHANRDAQTPLVKEYSRRLSERFPSDREYADAAYYLARDFIHYTPDPAPYEQITGFAGMLDLERGDCDDKCLFFATLMKARGIPCAFVVQSYDRSAVERDGFDHVYCEALIDLIWVGYDPTADGHGGTVVAPPGWRQQLSPRGFEMRYPV